MPTRRRHALLAVLIGLLALVFPDRVAGDHSVYADLDPSEDNGGDLTSDDGDPNDAGTSIPPAEACNGTTFETDGTLLRILPDGPRHPDDSLAFISGACVYLPPGYETSGLRYPVVYLLHGGGGTQAAWVGFGFAHDWADQAYAADPSQALILIMPDGNRGSWVDYEDGSFLIETYVIDYLIGYVDEHFRTIPTRSGRAITGLSNGGHGALLFAAKHPGLFVAAGGMSSNLGARTIAAVGPEGAVYYQGHVPFQLFGNLDGVDLMLHVGASCDPANTDASEDGSIANTYRCAYIAIDTAFLPDHVALNLRRDEVGHVGHYENNFTDGAHHWHFWRYWLRAFHLPFLFERLADPQPIGDPLPETPLPGSLRFRTIDPSFRVWGYEVDVARDVREFLELEAITQEGFEVQGSGQATITTAPRYTPGASYLATGTNDDPAPVSVTADPQGRLTLAIDLGPSHTNDQFTDEQAEADPDYWVVRDVLLRPEGAPAPPPELDADLDDPEGCETATEEGTDGCGAKGRDHFGQLAHEPPIEACAHRATELGIVDRIVADGPRRADDSLAFISGACVWLPKDHLTSGLRYPVLYLFHGGGGDQADWVTFGDIVGIMDRALASDPARAAIVVMPDGRSGQWYDYENGDFLIEEYVLEHLVPFVDARYPTIPDRLGRAIAGLSNGGYGAIHFAGKRPDDFAAAGGMSSNLGASALSGLGPEGGVHRNGSLPLHLAENYDAIDMVFNLATSCDTSDPACVSYLLDLSFQGAHDDFFARLDELGYPGVLDYETGPGAHQFSSWTPWLENRQLPFLQARMLDPQPLAAPTPMSSAPPSFRYRSIKPEFEIWDYEVGVTRGVREFLDLSNVHFGGFDIEGSGLASVLTAPRYAPGVAYAVTGAGGAEDPVVIAADGTGRLSIEVDLGPSHTNDQFTLEADDAAAADPGYWTLREVRIVETSSDVDGDGLPDWQDGCPENPAFGTGSDSGGVAHPLGDPKGELADGILDACQCGDVSGDGRVTGIDGSYIRRACLGLEPFEATVVGDVNCATSKDDGGPGSPAFRREKCDVGYGMGGDGFCSGNDGTVVKRATLGLSPGIRNTCSAYRPF